MCGRCQVVDFLPPGLWGATVRAPPSPLRANEKRSSWFSRSLDGGNRYIFLNFELSSLSRPFPLLFPIVNRRLLEQLWRLLLYVLVLPSLTGCCHRPKSTKVWQPYFDDLPLEKVFGTVAPYFCHTSAPHSERFWGVRHKNHRPATERNVLRLCEEQDS